MVVRKRRRIFQRLDGISFELPDENGELIDFKLNSSKKNVARFEGFVVKGEDSLGNIYCFWDFEAAIHSIEQAIDYLLSVESGTETKRISIRKNALTKAIAYARQHCTDTFSTMHRAFIYESAVKGIHDSGVKVVNADLKKDLLQESDSALGKRLGIQQGGARRVKAGLSCLRECYDSVIGDWQQASQIGMAMKFKGNWRETISTAFPKLPIDLVKRLQPMASWPDEISKICADKGGTENPDDIGLEHAARLCVASDYSYKLSTLRKTMQKQRRGISK